MGIDWKNRSHAITFRVQNFIGGERRPEHGDEFVEKYAPRDGSLLCRFGTSSARDVEEAVADCKRAFKDGRWAGLPAQRRKHALYKLASLIESNSEELALLDSVDVGKPISDALRFDVPTAAGLIRYSAESVDKLSGKVYAADQSSLSYQLHKPVGVVAGIVGWNFPLVLAAGKIGPVLAAGNCVVLKPSELTSFSAGRLAELSVEAGIPEGVFNVVHGGIDVGSALSLHPDVDLVTFTGSTSTGKRLLIAAGQSNMKRMVLECGGKAPNIVFDDCPDLDAVADSIVTRAFWNQGQVCTASSRLLIQETIKDELLAIIIEKTSSLVPADPLEESTKFGAVVSAAHKKKILQYISAGEEDGATIVHRSSNSGPYEGGFYVAPVIFSNVSVEHRIAREEIFGPVLSVIAFRDEEEAIGIANDTTYGLSAILWTKDVGRAHRVTQGVNAGSVVVNATERPTGGPGPGVVSAGGHKQSGIGIEGGVEGLEEYMSKTSVQMFV